MRSICFYYDRIAQWANLF